MNKLKNSRQCKLKSTETKRRVRDLVVKKNDLYYIYFNNMKLNFLVFPAPNSEKGNSEHRVIYIPKIKKKELM